MRLEAFSECHAGQGGFIHGMDTRAKLLFAFACIVATIASRSLPVPLFVGGLAVCLILAARTPVKAVFLRMSEPLVFASIIALFQACLTAGRPLAGFEILGFSVTLSQEGAMKGLGVIARVFGSVSVVLFLTMTTPAHRLLSAAARLRAPRALVELSLLTYRYVFVLLENAVTVYHSQKVRLGYSGLTRSIKSLGLLAGSVFLRAYAQAETTGEAMLMRGYNGEYIPAFREGFRFHDAAFLCVTLIPCLFVYIWTS